MVIFPIGVVEDLVAEGVAMAQDTLLSSPGALPVKGWREGGRGHPPALFTSRHQQRKYLPIAVAIVILYISDPPNNPRSVTYE